MKFNSYKVNYNSFIESWRNDVKKKIKKYKNKAIKYPLFSDRMIAYEGMAEGMSKAIEMLDKECGKNDNKILEMYIVIHKVYNDNHAKIFYDKEEAIIEYKELEKHYSDVTLYSVDGELMSTTFI